MKVVVVGASGNIGTALLRSLRAAEPGCDVIGVCRRPPVRQPPYDTATWHAIDVADPGCAESLAEVCHGADVVVSMAWLVQPSHDEHAMYRTNVEGTARVVEAAVQAGVSQLIYLSSIGAYSPAPDATPVNESWPTGGVASSSYSRHKAIVEAMLDRAEQEHPATVVSRIRPALVMHRAAASEIMRYFIGPLVPRAVFSAAARGALPAVPLPGQLTLQLVHADDVADAILRVLRRRAVGAFNLAAEPPLTGALLAALLGKRHVDVPAGLVRPVLDASWKLRLQPTSPGWWDLALGSPVMECLRARTELDWRPHWSSQQALADLLLGLAGGSGGASAPLTPRKPTRSFATTS